MGPISTPPEIGEASAPSKSNPDFMSVVTIGRRREVVGFAVIETVEADMIYSVCIDIDLCVYIQKVEMRGIWGK